MAPKATIYGLYDPVTDELRYIGKANNPDLRLASHMRDAVRRDTPLYRWIRCLGQAPLMKVIVHDCDDWEAEERKAIAHHREIGTNLLNVALGGNQPKTYPEQLRQAAKTATKKRPKYLMQVYRLVECNIRFKGITAASAAKGRAAKAKLMAAADVARANGTMDQLNESCRLFMEGKRHGKP